MEPYTFRKRIIQRYKKVFLKWGQQTTSHGIPKIFQAKNRLIQLIWLVCFLLSFGYCFYTVVNSFTLYYKHKTTRKISVIRDKLTEFPAVTICNLTPYNYFAKSTLIDAILESKGMTVDTAFQINDQYDPLGFYQVFSTQLNTLISSEFSGDTEFIQGLGFNLEKEMLLSCTYNKKPCKASDFTHFWSNKYGNCYTFNTNKYTNGTLKDTLKTSRTGRDYGLRLELLIGNPLAFISTGLLSYLTYRNGIFLSVHDSTILPELVTDGITIPAGTDTFVPIKRTFYKKMSKPYSNCFNSLMELNQTTSYGSVLYKYMQNYNLTTYNQDLCYKFCLQDQLIRVCNCSDATLPSIENVTYCSSDEDIYCMSKVFEVISAIDMKHLCENACESQCIILKYKLQDYVSSYPTDYYFSQLLNSSYYVDSTSAFQILKQSFTGLIDEGYGPFEAVQMAKELLVKVTINYDDLSYKVIEDAPLQTVETLFGVLGGQLGLFIGISFMSLVELLEILIKTISIYRRSKHFLEYDLNKSREKYQMNSEPY